MTSFLKRIVLLCLVLLAPLCQAQQRIAAVSYHAGPPFVEPQGGLTSDLVAYLNRALQGRYLIEHRLVARAEVDRMLARGEPLMLLFASSALFGGVQGGRYLWSAPLFDDRQELVSRSTQPFDYRGPASLAGQRFAGVRDHVYAVAPPMRASDERQLVAMLLQRQADVITLPSSMLKSFMMENLAFGAQAVASPQALNEFSRHIMFQRGMEALQADCAQILRQMQTDPVWLAVLKRHGLQPARAAASAAAGPATLQLVTIKPLDQPLMQALRVVLDRAFARAGLRYTLNQRPGERALVEFKSGKWDGDTNRVPAFHQAFPEALQVQPHLYNAHAFAVTALHDTPPRNWGELAGRRIAVPRGYQQLASNTAHVTARVWTNSEQSCLDMAAVGRVEYCIVRGADGADGLQPPRYGAALRASVIDQIPVYLWLGPQYQAEAERLSAALREMDRRGELHQLMGKFRLAH